jgi:pimeloyl-ACP methyl ester carboxylesterase
MEIDRLDARSTRHRVDWEGRHVAWRRFGSGTPLVLLHGGHGSWMHWIRNIEPLARAREVWVPDLPGYGDSDDAGTADALHAVLTPVVATLDRLVGRDTAIDVAGFSFGGLVAAHLASQRPGVERLALLGPAGHGSERRPRGELLDWKRAAAAGDARALARAMRHNLAMHMLSAEPEDIDDTAVDLHTRSCLRTRFRSKGLSRAGGLLGALEHRPEPTLMLWGEDDVTADPVSLMSSVPIHLPQCRVEVLRGAGHWLQYEQAGAVNLRLRAWLDDRP